MKNATYLTFALVVIYIAAGFSTSNSAGVCNLTPIDYIKTDKADAIVLDVRTQREYESGHLKGAILLDIYKSNFRDEISKLDKDKKYFVYCKIGSRSSSATNYMIQNGFKNVCNLKGGIVKLSEAGVQIVK